MGGESCFEDAIRLHLNRGKNWIDFIQRGCSAIGGLVKGSLKGLEVEYSILTNQLLARGFSDSCCRNHPLARSYKGT